MNINKNNQQNASGQQNAIGQQNTFENELIGVHLDTDPTHVFINYNYFETLSSNQACKSLVKGSTSFPNSSSQMNFQSPGNSEHIKDSNQCVEDLTFNNLIALQNSAMSSIPSSTSDHFLQLSTSSSSHVSVYCQNFTSGDNTADVIQSNVISKNQNNFDFENLGDSNLNIGINNGTNFLVGTSNQNQYSTWSDSSNPFTTSAYIQNSTSLINQNENSNVTSNQVYDNNNIQNIGIYNQNQSCFHDSYQWFAESSQMDFDYIFSDQK